MKFGTLRRILNPITVSWQKLKFLKFKMAAAAILKIAFLKQNGMSTRAKWQNLQIFKIQDGGRPPFWKSLNRHYVSEKSSDFDKIRYI